MLKIPEEVKKLQKKIINEHKLIFKIGDIITRKKNKKFYYVVKNILPSGYMEVCYYEKKKIITVMTWADENTWELIEKC